MTTKNKTKQIISALLIVSILLPTVLFSTPQKVMAAAGSTAAVSVPVADIPQETAGWLSQALHAIGVPSTVTNTSLHIKDFANWLLEQTLKTVAKATLAKMTQATINWINSDFHGAPLFLENPDSFFRDIAKSEVRRLVDMIGYDTFRFPFGQQTALNVINSYKSQLATNAQYTLSKVINDPDLLVRYRNDFNYGGWNGFLTNTQYLQNNYLGFNMIVQQNLASRLEGTLVAPAQKVQNLLQQGMGFLSPQTCPSNPNYNNGTNEFQRPSYKPIPFDTDKYPGASGSLKWSEENEKAKAEWAKNNTCPGGLVNTTPGSVAANQIMTAMSSSYRQSELAAALGNSLSAIFDALIGHFLDKGLSALASTTNPTSGEDNWSYNGQTFGGSSNTIAGTLDIPQNVSVTVGQGTSTNISGGKAPYRITQSSASRAKVTATIDTSSSSGPKLTIVAGNTPTIVPVTVTVYDSSIPAKTTTVTVTVNEVGALLANGARNPLVLVDVNQSKSLTISGGEGNYSIQTGPDETKAVAVFSDTSLVIIGVAPGSTYVEIKDSSNPIKTIRINITIAGAGDLIIQQNVSASVGRTVNIPISGGIAPYSIVTNFDAAVATAVITGPNLDTITITGLAIDRQTAIIVQDSSTPPKSTSVTISTTPFIPLVVSPQTVSSGVGQGTNATISGGTSPYKIKTPPNAAIANAQIFSATPTTLTVAGIASGTTQVTIQDSSTTNPQTFLVNITINNLTVTPPNVSVSIGYGGQWRTVNATISGGTAPYRIQIPPNATVANAQIDGTNGNILRITASNTRGSTFTRIQDSSTTHPQTFDVSITAN